MKDLKVKTQEVKKGAVKRANDLEQSSLNSLEENTISPTVKVPAALLSTLKSLQKQSTKVEQDGERANASLYNHLVNAYRWWRKAKEIEGFIEAEYEKLPLRKSSGQADPNFIPVLRVICGKDSSLQDQEFQRRSRALNAIHIEVEKTPEKYESGGIAKLVNFIKFKGGVSELAGYRNSDQGPAEKYEDTAESKQKAKEEEANRSALINAAVNPIVPYDEGASPIIDGLPDYVSTDERNCFLLLVQQADGGNRVIARSSEPELIETILVGNHRKRFEAHSSVTRPLLELIQTQCYPKHLKGVAKKLVDTNVLDGHGRKKFKSTPRLMFVHDSQQFLLSPINAYSGVVSLVTPNQQVLGKCKQDIFMPTTQSAALEQQLLQDFDFNLYDAGELEQFHESDTPASHALALVHCADAEKKIDLHFLPFYDVLPQPLDQVGLNPDYKFKPQWQATLPHSYFQKLADQFLEPWLEGKGKHLKRNCNALIKVAFGSKFLDIEFIYNDGVFEGRKAIEFAKKTGSKKSFSSLFLSKDWILAFRNIALLPVDGNVSLGINDDVLRVDFTTKEDSGAKHEIYIPTADLDGNRSTVPFIRYKPGLVYDESIDKINDELNIFVGGEAAALKGEVGS